MRIYARHKSPRAKKRIGESNGKDSDEDTARRDGRGRNDPDPVAVDQG